MSTQNPSIWAGIYCPELPLAAVWQSAPTDGPLAVHTAAGGQLRILQTNTQAHQHGIRPSQRLSHALALLPRLESRPRCLQAEARSLERIALAAYRHSHQVVMAPPDTVLLEVAGSRRLRGGLAPLLKHLREDLSCSGFEVRLGLAPIAAAAGLLARHGQAIYDRPALRRYLSGLALDQLALEPARLKALNGCGLRSLGELRGLPKAEQARRFGTELIRHIDQLYGELDTPLAQWRPAEHFAERLELPVATADSQALLFVFQRAIGHLERWLEVRDQGLTRLHVTLMREDEGPDSHFDIGLARPGFDRARLLELIALKLEGIRLTGAIDGLKLRAESTSQRAPAQADLLSGGNRNDAWPALLDRLGARLGEEGLASLAPSADHRPERAWRWVAPGTSAPCQDSRPRPAWLLPSPRPCDPGRMRLEEGPERIETGWWDGQDCRRDYWIARDRHGRRLWIFQEYKPRTGWFIHGLFG